MKSIRLKVTPLGEVRVSAPYGISDTDIEKMVKDRRNWIRKQQQAFENSPQAEAERATKEEQMAWRRVVSACVPPLVETWEPILGVKVKQLTYRNMKSRWGSCQPSTGKFASVLAWRCIHQNAWSMWWCMRWLICLWRITALILKAYWIALCPIGANETKSSVRASFGLRE